MVKNGTNLSTYKFLIIGGTSKAGTTSVFNYLARHPQICPSAKETRFFLDADYPLPSKARYDKDGPDAYLSLFDPGLDSAWRFEATPDYLYSPTTATTIHQTLSNVRLIFILREPISRLLSWYRFGRKRVEIGLKTTFDEYVELQKQAADSNISSCKHPAFYALQHGRYSIYLRPYLDQFGRSSVHVAFYEDLQRNPLAFIRSICHWIGLDDGFFHNYQFDVVNKGTDVRSPHLHKVYVDSQERARKLIRFVPGLGRALRRVRYSLDAMYEKMNVVKNREVAMSGATRDFILSYYQDEPARLKQMLGVEPPWSSNAAAAQLELK